MRGFWKSMLAGITLAVLFGMPGLVKCSYAETDVTDKVELVKSRMMFDRSTSQNYLDVSVKNISEDVLLTPIKVVVDSISDPSVSVANADGYTDTGMPYLEFSIENGQLLSQEATNAKSLVFDNPDRKRFTFENKIISYLSTPISVVNRSAFSLEEKIENFLLNVTPPLIESVHNRLNGLSDRAIQSLAENMKQATLLSIENDVATFNMSIFLPDGDVIETTFEMMLTNSVWKISSF